MNTPSPPSGPLLRAIHDALLAHYGPQSWWPTRTGSAWEIMLGAVLTQRTTWTNVELSLGNMVARWGTESLAHPDFVRNATDEELAVVLRPTGFYSSKFRTLRNLAGYLETRGGIEGFVSSSESTEEIRKALLSLWGIGPETADAILLYALGRATFIGDAYALRLASRWGLTNPKGSYEETRALFMNNLPHKASLFNEYHALIVTHAKALCRPRPLCHACPLNDRLSLKAGDECHADGRRPTTGGYLNKPLEVGEKQEGTWRCPRVGVITQA